MTELCDFTAVKVWDKLWSKALVRFCDLKTFTKVTAKVQKLEAENGYIRMGQWCRAVLKACDDDTAGGMIMTVCDECAGIPSEEEAQKFIEADERGQQK